MWYLRIIYCGNCVNMAELRRGYSRYWYAVLAGIERGGIGNFKDEITYIKFHGKLDNNLSNK